jgi:hypothetical protein
MEIRDYSLNLCQSYSTVGCSAPDLRSPSKRRLTGKATIAMPVTVFGGHSTLKQVKVYTAQANQLLLARGAQNLRDAMYRQQLHDEAIRAASNVTKLRA